MGVINQQTSLGAKNIFREWDHIYVDAVEVRFFLKWLWSHMFFFQMFWLLFLAPKVGKKTPQKAMWLFGWCFGT